jgi:membrane-associated phospholipid phosphatase
LKSSRKFVESYSKKLSLWIVVVITLFAAALISFTYISHEIFLDKEEQLDHQFFKILSPHINSPLTNVMEIITYGASSRFLQIGYALLVIGYLTKKNWKRAIEIAVIGLGGFVINYFMKLSFQRQRPADPLIEPLQNFSFPSGHATSGFIFYGLLVYLLWKSKLKQVYKYIFGAILLLIALLIGFSRIYLKLHYLSDVVAGFCIGFAWLAVAVWMMEKLKKKSDVEMSKFK